MFNELGMHQKGRTKLFNRESPISEAPKEKGYDGWQPGSDHAMDAAALRKSSVAAMMSNDTGEIKNPLIGIPKAELMRQVEEFAHKNDMVDELELLKKGALCAQSPAEFENIVRLAFCPPIRTSVSV